MLQRYFFEIAYNGTSFHGWQRQPNEISVQQEIETAFTKLNSNCQVSIVGCGRTDTGVHAKHYIFHVELEEHFNLENIVFKLNRMLPVSIAIYDFWEVGLDTHARFQAISRTYRYFLNFQKDPFKLDTSLHLKKTLDFEVMNEASKRLLGTKDFTSFSKVNTDTKTNICSISKAECVKVDDSNYYFEITADRFLRNMVRSTVGTLLEVGHGKILPNDIDKIIEAKDRRAAAVSVPAHGLFLWDIRY